RIQTETDRLARLVADLLDLSRIESEMPLAIADTPASVIVEDAIERVSAFAEAKGTAISLEQPDRALVRADAGAAATALANLLDNAVRYAPAGTPVLLAVASTGRVVSFTVADEGPGIPSEELGRIFERFYRVDKARARATGGTGLGLAIVKHVAERHGGRVEASSEFGRGSRFVLVLPAGGAA
ncbi:MAG TPA: ATP-binding protein, partial [Actinomycetota bacterium]|nr:ATP-binding protein [Actinomycetota bacterium]